MAAASEGQDPVRFRRRLLAYLQEGMHPEAFQDLVEAEEVPFERCWELVEKVNSEFEADELRGITIRFLESYPDHPGLLLLRAISEALAGDRDDAVVVESLRALFVGATERYGVRSDRLSEIVEGLLALAVSRVEMVAPALIMALVDAGTLRADGRLLYSGVMQRARQICPAEVDDLEANQRLAAAMRAVKDQSEHWRAA